MKQFLVRILIGVASVGTLFIGYTPDSNAADWYKPDRFQVWSFYGKSTWTTVGPDLDDNYTWANISLCAGKRVYPWLAVRAGYRIDHISSPFHKSREGDTGVTIGAIEVNFGWAF